MAKHRGETTLSDDKFEIIFAIGMLLIMGAALGSWLAR